MIDTLSVEITDIDELAEWHRNKAKAIRGLLRRCDLGEKELEAYDFHSDAAKLVESFSCIYQQRRLAEAQRNVLERAIVSFEQTAKILLIDSKDLKKFVTDL